jgi:hypothetical protein
MAQQADRRRPQPACFARRLYELRKPYSAVLAEECELIEEFTDKYLVPHQPSIRGPHIDMQIELKTRNEKRAGAIRARRRSGHAMGHPRDHGVAIRGWRLCELEVQDHPCRPGVDFEIPSNGLAHMRGLIERSFRMMHQGVLSHLDRCRPRRKNVIACFRHSE